MRESTAGNWGTWGREGFRNLQNYSVRPRCRGADFLGLLFVATIIVVTHLNKDGKGNIMSTAVTPQVTTWTIDQSILSQNSK